MSRALRTLAVISGLSLVFMATPASAQQDTTPPQLVSFSIAPNIVDASSSTQVVTVTATITDDLSGYASGYVVLSAPGRQHEAYGALLPVSGDLYAASITFPQYAQAGVWANWSISLEDRTGNRGVLHERDLLDRGTNVAVGLLPFATSYSRSFQRFFPSPGRATVRFNKDLTSPCSSDVLVIVQWKGKSGWTEVGRGYTSYGYGRFILDRRHGGRYRAIAPAMHLGTPSLSTCVKASITSSG